MFNFFEPKDTSFEFSSEDLISLECMHSNEITEWENFIMEEIDNEDDLPSFTFI